MSESAKNIRGGHKAVCTKYIKQLATTTDVPTVTKIYNELQRQREIILKCDSDILQHMSAQEITKDID